MKKLFLIITLSLFCAAAMVSADTQPEEPAAEQNIPENSSDAAHITLDTKTGFPVITNKPFVMFNEGAAVSWVTRIIKQQERSNFVWQDFLLGAYFSVTSRNMRPFDFTIRTTAYYPFSMTFNEHPQKPATPLHFAFDLYAAPIFRLSMWDYVFVNLSGGLHFFFQNADRWNYIHLGIGALAGIELPIAWHWTILIDGIASLDYGNLGTNYALEPFDYVWQYQVSVGVRYSKKGENRYSYIPSKKRAALYKEQQNNGI